MNDLVITDVDYEVIERPKEKAPDNTRAILGSIRVELIQDTGNIELFLEMVNINEMVKEVLKNYPDFANLPILVGAARALKEAYHRIDEDLKKL